MKTNWKLEQRIRKKNSSSTSFPHPGSAPFSCFWWTSSQAELPVHTLFLRNQCETFTSPRHRFLEKRREKYEWGVDWLTNQCFWNFWRGRDEMGVRMPQLLKLRIFAFFATSWILWNYGTGKNTGFAVLFLSRPDSEGGILFINIRRGWRDESRVVLWARFLIMGDNM